MIVSHHLSFIAKSTARQKKSRDSLPRVPQWSLDAVRWATSSSRLSCGLTSALPHEVDSARCSSQRAGRELHMLEYGSIKLRETPLEGLSAVVMHSQ